MKFIAIDLENNQPSGRITQIGGAVFDTQKKDPYIPVDEFSMFLDPGEPINWDQDLSSGCTLGELLGEDWKTKWEIECVSSTHAFRQFWEWQKMAQSGKKIIQWGRGDLGEICSQGKELGIYYPKNLKEINLKRLYQTFFAPALGLKQMGGLKSSCENMGLSFEGRAHDALVDAVNTGRLAVKMFEIIKFYGIAEKYIRG